MVVVWLGLPPLNALTVNKYGAKLSTAVAPGPESKNNTAAKIERPKPPWHRMAEAGLLAVKVKMGMRGRRFSREIQLLLGANEPFVVSFG